MPRPCRERMNAFGRVRSRQVIGWLLRRGGLAGRDKKLVGPGDGLFCGTQCVCLQFQVCFSDKAFLKHVEASQNDGQKIVEVMGHGAQVPRIQ